MLDIDDIRNKMAFDEQFVPDTSIDDLDEELWRPLVARAEESGEDALVKCRLLVETQGEMRASVSGVLMCSKKPDAFLPNAFIEAVRYRGTRRDSNYQIDARRITGPLNQQVDAAMHFVRKNQFTAPKFACLCSTTDWKSTRPARCRIPSPSTASTCAKPRATNC